MKNSILNTDIFKVIITNCKTFWCLGRPALWGRATGKVVTSPDPVTSRDSAALSGHSAVLGRATDMKEQE